MSLMDLFSSHFLAVFAITSDCSSLVNFSIVGTSHSGIFFYTPKHHLTFHSEAAQQYQELKRLPTSWLTVVEMPSLLFFSPDLQRLRSGASPSKLCFNVIHQSKQLWIKLPVICPKINFVFILFFLRRAMFFRECICVILVNFLKSSVCH